MEQGRPKFFCAFKITAYFCSIKVVRIFCEKGAVTLLLLRSSILILFKYFLCAYRLNDVTDLFPFLLDKGRCTFTQQDFYPLIFPRALLPNQHLPNVTFTPQKYILARVTFTQLGRTFTHLNSTQNDFYPIYFRITETTLHITNMNNSLETLLVLHPFNL